MKKVTYWDTFESAYQMGIQKHRVYMLDLLKEKGVESILDVGCGTGPIWGIIKEARERGENKWDFTYLGTDYSWAMIEQAKKSFPEIHWQIEDARHLTLGDSTWDCVLLMHCLDHVDDYKQAIKEAARVSKKYVCIILWRPFVLTGTQLNDRNMMDKKEGEEPWKDTYLHEYSREALVEAFDEANLKIVQETYGEEINSNQSSYNYLFLLEKK